VNTWQIVRRDEKRATHPRLLPLLSGELVIDEVTVDDKEGKQFLIEHGALRQRARKWKRVRQYGYSAECWLRHEAKEREQAISNLWRGIYQVVTEAHELEVYQTMPLRDRTRYEKIMSMPRPLTADEYADAEAFVMAWRAKVSQ
jgi:hypothetical protein